MPRNLPEPVSFVRAVADFRDGRQTPRVFLEQCLAAIKRHEKSIHAFVTLDVGAARKAADAATRRYRTGRMLSAIDGCPIAVKDIIATADLPTQMNSPIYRRWRPKSDAACVAALRQAVSSNCAAVKGTASSSLGSPLLPRGTITIRCTCYRAWR